MVTNLSSPIDIPGQTNIFLENLEIKSIETEWRRSESIQNLNIICIFSGLVSKSTRIERLV